MSASPWPDDAGESERLYHYCPEAAARAIMDEELPVFATGFGSHHGFGMYATDIPPVDEDTLELVSQACFGGQARPAELSHVLVLHSANAQDEFVLVSPSEWIIDRDSPWAEVELDTLLIEVRRWDGSIWTPIAQWDGWEWTPQPARPKRENIQ